MAARHWKVVVAVIAVAAAALLWYPDRGRDVPRQAAAAAPPAQVQSRAFEKAGHGAGAVEGTRAERIPIPIRYRFGTIASLVAADGEEDLLRRYPHYERSIITGFYANYGYGAAGGRRDYSTPFSFHDEDELRWLVRNGYPTPDDILAASRMTDQELAAMAAKGNFKARVFLLGRNPRANDGPEPSSVREVMAQRVREDALATGVLREGSPFGAHAYARYAKERGKNALAAASLSYASWLGDGRRDFLAGFVSEHESLSPIDILVEFRIIQLSSMRNPELQNLQQMARRPRFGSSPR